MNALVEANLDLVFTEAKCVRGQDYEAYLTSAYIGLTQAAESWQKELGASFRTHARRRINGSIRDQIREEHGRKGRNSNAKFMDSFLHGGGDFVSVQPIDQSTEDVDFALSKLTDRQREIARLRMLETPINSIATALGISKSLVELEIRTIKNTLKARLACNSETRHGHCHC
jgi:RNA polymerase sigma factor (sigma-70 family)